MNCQDLDQHLFDLVEGTLPESEAARVQAHLGSCADCGREVAAYRRTVAFVGSLTPEIPVAEAFWDRQRARIMQAVLYPVPQLAWQAPPMYLVTMLTVVGVYIVGGLPILGASLSGPTVFARPGPGVDFLATALVYVGLAALAVSRLSSSLDEPELEGN